jgi:diadenosine tetraphosphate (Ap4A) HIT family hydrolase
MTCPICTWTPDLPEYPLVCETKYWRVVLAPNQCLVGRCIVQLKRHCGDVAETHPDELLEWLEVVKTMEDALRQAFDATMFNWSCYMNHAYRENPSDPHIHWWIVPRYNHAVNADGLIFVDPHFGSPYDHSMRLGVSTEMRQHLVKLIREAIIAGGK